MKSHFQLTLFLLLVLIQFSFAQNDSRLAPGLSPANQLDKTVMPKVDNKLLVDEEMARRAPGVAPRFAEAFEVNINPDTHGEWSTASNGNEVWRMRMYSGGAKSLNLGFSKYVMPEEGSLILYSSDYQSILGPFTKADNDDHEQLWTPIVDGDDLIIEVQLPPNSRSTLQLELKSVNHDFLGFSSMSMLSGSCNLDVICNEADGWGIVDGYRDIIQSVAVISTGGGTFCTGFLINNVNNDCTPFFMTANHCGIGPGNAPSLVAYWNFENSICRQPNSPESGAGGDGILNDFNSGAVHRCSYAPSDMTLVEFDDPISETADPFFPGWSTEFVMPQDTIICVHHPSTDEKRITFEFDPAQPGMGLNSTVVDISVADHIIIPDWDIGTTEPGSSGSPLFNNQKQVIGQLHGGGAACGNNLYDSYGWFHTSWEGGGTPETALKYWLDPNDTGVTSISGKNCAFTVLVNDGSLELCSPEDAVYTLEVSENFASDVTLSASNIPAGATASFDPNPASPGANVTLTISGTGAVASGNYQIDISGTDGVETANTSVFVTLFDTIPVAVELINPADNAVDELSFPQYSWNAFADGTTYDLEVSSDMAFTDIVDMAFDLEEAEYSGTGTLEAETTYYWRVKANNECGEGPWSEIRNFTTANIFCSNTSSDEVVEISSSGTPVVFSELVVAESGEINDVDIENLDITHTWVGDLDVSIESPEGTVVQLFNTSDCQEDNMLVSFNDTAPNTAGDFAVACDGGGTAISGAYQPVELLSAFIGEDAQGTWTLTISDNANQDGGTVNGWDLILCTVAGPNISVESSVPSVENCQGLDVQFDVTVGDGFTNPVTLSAAGNPAGTTVSFSENPIMAGATATVTISGVAAPGSYPITIMGDDGIESNSTEVSYVVNGPPLLSNLVQPADGAIDVILMPQLAWDIVSDATSYELQVATDELFNNIILTESLTGTTYTFFNPLDEGTNYYWRITSLNDCGGSLTDAYLFTTENVNDINEIGGNAFVIQPNPSKDKFNVIFDQVPSEDLYLELYTVDGKLLRNVVFERDSNSIEINLSNHVSGIYIVKLISAKSFVARKLTLHK